MMQLFQSSYYWLDLLVGYGFPAILFVFYLRGRVGQRDWRLFWIGALIGLFWEVPIFALSAMSKAPIVAWVREFPMHWTVFMVSHTLWDGAIFLVGVWFVALICRPPVLARFRLSELAVMIAWGQASALLVELSSITNDAWVYVEGYWWNPTLFYVGAHPITLMMQPIWFVAPILFYFISLRMKDSNR